MKASPQLRQAIKSGDYSTKELLSMAGKECEDAELSTLLSGVAGQLHALESMITVKFGNKLESELKLESQTQTPDKERCLPANWKRLSKAEQKRTLVLQNTPTMILIGKWFGRRETTLWTVADAVALKDIKPTKETVEGMGYYYTAEIPKQSDIRRRDLPTLLNNWHSELDRARAYANSQS